MEGQKSRKERKRGDILRAALELFHAHGFKRVSIEEIARLAGVSPATIYNHFADKGGLVRETIMTQLESKMAKYREIMTDDRPFTEKLEAIIFEKTEAFEGYGGEWMQAIMQGGPEIIEFAMAAKRETEQLFGKFLEDGIRQGYVNPDLSTEAIILYLEILQKGIIESMPRMAQSPDGAKLVKDLLSLYFYGLVGQERKPQDK